MHATTHRMPLSLATLPLLCFVCAGASSDYLPTYWNLDQFETKPACRPRNTHQSARDIQQQRINDYMQHGQFPLNVEHAYTTPVFVDPRGVPCAVAYLMSCDGYGDAVAAIAKDNVTVHVMDVMGGPMLEWLSQSGLSQAEAARVQPSYEFMNNNRRPQVDANAAATQTAENIASAALLTHIDKERLRLQHHFKQVLEELQPDTPLRNHLETLLEGERSELSSATGGLASTLRRMVTDGPLDAAMFVAQRICTFAPLLSTKDNVELYANKRHIPRDVPPPQYVVSGVYVGPPWARYSAAIILVEILLERFQVG
jgi:hypothetical protein